jgi:molybdenum cofactor cytidylyltransferase
MTTASRHRAGEVAVSAVVLAAGCATRLGEQKVLLPVEGRPMVQRVTDAALGSKAVETIVVVGHEADAVRKALAGRTATVIVNPDYAAGMSTSLQAGVRAVAIGCDAALFLLADQPFVASSLIDQLIERFAETRASVVRPVVAGRVANPVLMSAALFPEILQQRGDVGGRRIVERHAGEVCLVPIDDPRLLIDIDSAADYALLGERR